MPNPSSFPKAAMLPSRHAPSRHLIKAPRSATSREAKPPKSPRHIWLDCFQTRMSGNRKQLQPCILFISVVARFLFKLKAVNFTTLAQPPRARQVGRVETSRYMRATLCVSYRLQTVFRFAGHSGIVAEACVPKSLQSVLDAQRAFSVVTVHFSRGVGIGRFRIGVR